jgi:hypothetical protein
VGQRGRKGAPSQRTAPTRARGARLSVGVNEWLQWPRQPV